MLYFSCQFVVKASEDYTVHLADPDTPVHWEQIEQVVLKTTSTVPSCPICLYPPKAGNIMSYDQGFKIILSQFLTFICLLTVCLPFSLQPKLHDVVMYFAGHVFFIIYHCPTILGENVQYVTMPYIVQI